MPKGRKMEDYSVKKIYTGFVEQGWTLSVAESCTGGALAARLVRQAGASHYFLGGVIAYSNQLKITLLGVNPDDLQMHGAVSEVVVVQMARGMQRLTGSDYALAISGIAGPEGGTDQKPVGTMCAAIVSLREQEIIAWTFQLEGERQDIINQCLDTLLQRLGQLTSRQ